MTVSKIEVTQPAHNVVSTLKQRHIATLNRRCIHVENESFDDVALRRLFRVTYRRPLDVVLTSNLRPLDVV